ncbi:MAG TPA: YdeI/OmpD-associated family protein [Acidobacteriaceae bacterium]
MKQTFSAKLVSRGPSGAWTHLDVPFSVEQTWGTRARVAICGTVNGFPIRTSLFPRGHGVFYMAFTKAMQEGAQAHAGDTVSVVMEPDTAPRKVEVPAYLRKALQAAPAHEKAFAKLSYSHKKEYVDWIAQAKRRETRVARIEKMLKVLGTKKTPKE